MLALLLEDEAMIALDLETTLAELGFEVATFATCADAETWLQDHQPNVAIVDLHLSDGPCTRAVELLVASAIPFIVHTGGGDRKDLPSEAFYKGEWVEKPSDPDRLGKLAWSLANE